MKKLWKNASTSGPPIVEVFFVYIILGIASSITIPAILASLLSGRGSHSNPIFEYVMNNYLFFVVIVSALIIVAWLLIVYLKLRPVIGKDDENIYIYHSFIGKKEYPIKAVKKFEVLESSFLKTELGILTTYNFKHEFTIPLFYVSQHILDMFLKDKLH